MKAVRDFHSEDPGDRARVLGSDMADKSDGEKRATFLQREHAARTEESMKVSYLALTAHAESAQNWSGEKTQAESDDEVNVETDEAGNGNDNGCVGIIGRSMKL